MTEDVAARCLREVEELHAFFVGWFLGDPEVADDGRCTSVLGDSFLIVTPGGTVMDRASILGMVRGARGSMTGTVFEITVRNLQVREACDGLVVVTYEEHQLRGAARTARMSTAVLAEVADTPNGLQWHLVHETWLPGSGPQQS